MDCFVWDLQSLKCRSWTRTKYFQRPKSIYMDIGAMYIGEVKLNEFWLLRRTYLHERGSSRREDFHNYERPANADTPDDNMLTTPNTTENSGHDTTIWHSGPRIINPNPTRLGVLVLKSIDTVFVLIPIFHDLPTCIGKCTYTVSQYMIHTNVYIACTC